MHREKCSYRLRPASGAPVFANGAVTAAIGYVYNQNGGADAKSDDASSIDVDTLDKENLAQIGIDSIEQTDSALKVTATNGKVFNLVPSSAKIFLRTITAAMDAGNPALYQGAVKINIIANIEANIDITNIDTREHMIGLLEQKRFAELAVEFAKRDIELELFPHREN